jgi:hypothetical protein
MMGREIRRVPAGWEHPQKDGGGYQPLMDEDYESAAEAWLAALMKWERGEDAGRHDADVRYYWDWDGGPPKKEYYRPKWTDVERTHVQMYETVSEGTPVTPVFATKDELVEYLVAHGDYWDQKRGHGGWPRGAAERFVTSEWAPSLIVHVSPSGAGAVLQSPRDMA